jgi:hypothetical protein
MRTKSIDETTPAMPSPSRTTTWWIWCSSIKRATSWIGVSGATLIGL